MTIETGIVIISAIVGICSIATFVLTRFANVRKSGEESGALFKEIEHIRKGVDSTNRSIQNIQDELKNYVERLVIVETSVKAVHRRLDNDCDLCANKKTKTKAEKAK